MSASRSRCCRRTSRSSLRADSAACSASDTDKGWPDVDVAAVAWAEGCKRSAWEASCVSRISVRRRINDSFTLASAFSRAVAASSACCSWPIRSTAAERRPASRVASACMAACASSRSCCESAGVAGAGGSADRIFGAIAEGNSAAGAAELCGAVPRELGPCGGGGGGNVNVANGGAGSDTERERPKPSSELSSHLACSNGTGASSCCAPAPRRSKSE